MAIIYEDALKKNILSKKLSPVYLLFGDDGFLKQLYVKKIASMTADVDDVFNYAKFSGDCNLQDVYDFAVQLPMMADKKCVILCDYDFEHASKSDMEKLCTLLTDTSDTTVLILWFDSLAFDYKKNSAAKKIMTAVGKGGGLSVLLNHRRPAELVKILTDGAGKRGCHMDSTAVRYLIEVAGEDISTLQNELEKLCNFNPGGTITKETVDLVSIKSTEASVYNITKDIMDCNITGALKTLDELFFLHMEPMIILYTISANYVDIYRVACALKSGKKIEDVASTFGYKGREFVLDRARSSLSKLDKKKLALSFDALLDCDRVLKANGCDQRVVLEQLIVKLVYIIVKGEAVDKA